MSVQLAIVGPGRVGQALGRRWAEAGLRLIGYLGRRPTAAAAAVAFAGAGRELRWPDLRQAQVVVLAVGDAELPAVVRQGAAAGAVRPCSLWLHCSGRHDLSVLGPVADQGARRGSLHPVCPFPDAEAGYRALPDKPAVLLGDDRAQRLLVVLARKAGMRPLWSEPGDRALYHAACALAANGLTALHALVDRVLAAHGGLSSRDSRSLADALMAAALDACAERGPMAALSGPVVRGDAETVADHLRALAAAPAALPAYRALMTEAVALAESRGALDPVAAQKLRDLLAGP